MHFLRPRENILLLVSLLTACLPSDLLAATATQMPTDIVQEGDLEMSCNQLSAEALAMQKIVNNTQEIQNDAKIEGRGISVAGTAAGFLVGTLTGGIGIAAAGMLAKNASDSEGDKAENLQDIAYQRRSFMLGIFKAKKCMGPIEQTLLAPAKLPDPIDVLTRIETASGGIEPITVPDTPAQAIPDTEEVAPKTAPGDTYPRDAINGKQPPRIEAITNTPPFAKPRGLNN